MTDKAPKTRTRRIVSDGTSSGTRVEDSDGNVIPRVTSVEWSVGPDRLGRAAIHCVGVEVDVVATDAEVVTESVEDARARLGFANLDDTPVEVARSYLRAVETAVRGLRVGLTDLSRLVDVDFDFGGTPDADGGETDGA